MQVPEMTWFDDSQFSILDGIMTSVIITIEITSSCLA